MAVPDPGLYVNHYVHFYHNTLLRIYPADSDTRTAYGVPGCLQCVLDTIIHHHPARGPQGFMMPDLETSIVIINWNPRDLLAACLRSIQQTTQGLNVEIIVVDNASSDGSQDMLR